MSEQLSDTSRRLAAARKGNRRARRVAAAVLRMDPHDLRTPLTGLRAMAEVLGTVWPPIPATTFGASAFRWAR